MAPERSVTRLCVVKVYTEENILVNFVESSSFTQISHHL